MTDLVTLGEYKETSGLTATKDDARLELLITSISQLVKTYCGQTFLDYWTAEKTEYFNIDWDTSAVQLTECPVKAITSVKERSSYAEDYVARTTGAYEFYLDPATDSILRTNGSTGYLNWSKGPAAVEVVYTAGYADTPEDLKLAIYDLITYYFKDEHKEMRVIAGSTIRNNASASQTNNVTFPDHIKRVLDLYKSF